MHHPETMKVIYACNPSGGQVDINVSDFDPKLHIVEGAEEKPAPKKRGRPRKIKVEGT